MKKECINPDCVAIPVAPYSTVVKVTEATGRLFLCGMVACDINDNICFPSDIAAQTQLIVDNITKALEAVGASPENVVRTTTYVVADAMDDFFSSGASLIPLKAFDHPADTLVGVAKLHRTELGVLVEINAEAAI